MAHGRIPQQPLQIGEQCGAVCAGGRRHFALAYGVTEFQGYKTRAGSQNKAKDWWITHLGEVRYDPAAGVKGRFSSCLSSKHSAVLSMLG